MATKISLTNVQRSEIEGVVGHKLTESSDLAGNSPNLVLKLTPEQSSLIKNETGKDLAEITLTEIDFKRLSSSVEYERGLTVNTN